MVMAKKKKKKIPRHIKEALKGNWLLNQAFKKTIG